MLDAIDEGNALNDLGHAVAAVKLSPFPLRRHRRLERHGQPSFAAEAAFGFAGAMAQGGKSTLYWVGGSDLFPMFRWEVIEDRQRVAIFARLGHRFLVFHTGGFDEEVKGGVSFGLGCTTTEIMHKKGIDGLIGMKLD